MPRFSYRAKDGQLQLVEGTIEAESEASAVSRLGRDGIFPISLVQVDAEAVAAPTLERHRPRVPAHTLAQTTRQLADLLGGGLPLLNALMLLAKQTEHPTVRQVIESMVESVREGRSLSEAMSEHPDVFPPLYRSMVKAGEVGGGLEQSLSRVAEFGEHEAELRGRVISAAAYPLFVLAMAIVITIFLIAYVIPKLSLVILDTDQVLPLPTRLLLGVSHLLTRGWWAILLGLFVAWWALRGWLATASGRALTDRLVLRLPGIGLLIRKLETARFVRTLGIMIGQGVPILQALDVVTSNLTNVSLRQAVAQVDDAVREGSSLAAALSATQEFPEFVSNMVAVGEESGTVDAALLKVAGTYEREVDRLLRMLTTILEPLLLLLVGGVVMFIVLSMLLPIFQIGLGVQ